MNCSHKQDTLKLCSKLTLPQIKTQGTYGMHFNINATAVF